MSGDPAAQTHTVHVVALYPLMSGEGIRDQRRPYAGHLVSRNASPSPAAADGQAPGDLTPRHRPGQGHYKIRVVISCNQLMGAEVRPLITGGLEGRSQLHFQLKPTMVCSYANAHHFSSTLSASNPEITSNSSSSMPLWRKRWNVPLRSSSDSSMFLSARCIAARRLAFSLARDSAHARKSETKRYSRMNARKGAGPPPMRSGKVFC